MPGVAIVGGGLAGLSAAYHLEKALGDGAVPIALFEAADRPGGVVRTERVDGYTIDSGPDSLLSEPADGIALCRELGLGGDLVPVEGSARKIWIYSRGRLRDLPAGMPFFVPDPWGMARSGLFSWPGLVRAGLEPIVPRGPDRPDESVAAFFRRRLGREVVDRMLEPMLAGIYAGDLERLSMAALLPRFRDLVRTHGSLIRGMSRARAGRPTSGASGGGGAPVFYGLRDGLQQMVDALRGRLRRTQVRCATPVGAVRRSASGRYEVLDGAGRTLGEFDAVALAVSAYAAARMVRGLDPILADALDAIPYVSTATVFLAFDRRELEWVPEGHGFFVPTVEGLTLRGATLVSNKFEGRSPRDRFLIRASIGGTGREAIVDCGDDEIVETVLADLGQVGGWTAEPRLGRVFRYPKLNPQYEVGHLERVTRIARAAAAHPGLAFAGSAYHGSGIPAVVADGRRAADAIRAALRR